MTDTTDIAATAATDGTTGADAGAPRRTGSLSALRLPQLQALAAELGISGTGRMRKVDLLAAIREHQSGVPQAAARADVSTAAPAADAPADAQGTDGQGTDGQAVSAASTATSRTRSRRASAPAGAPSARQDVLAADAGQDDPAAQLAARPADGADVPTRTTTDTATGAVTPGTAPAESPAGSENGPSRTGELSTPSVPSLDDFAARSRPEQRERLEARAEGERTERLSRRERARRDRVREPDQQVELPSMPVRERVEQAERPDRDGRADRTEDVRADDRGERGEDRADRPERGDRAARADRAERTDRADRAERTDRVSAGPAGPADDDDDRGGRRGRGRNRYRDRKGRRGGRGEAPEVDTDISEDDVLLPVAGILDVLDNYAFIRTSGYLAGANDVYVSLGQVKKNNLRPGDAVTGAVRQPREGEQQNQRQKFNALVRVDTVNGAPPEQARQRPEFTKLTPLYPQERLRLETEPNVLTTRIIDLMSPLGKGQRGLIVAPPKAGKTMVMQAIANAITTNNPECHLMVVLVDERPEEVTDMQRTIKGEVIASTFDRPASDHTAVAELAIERAKRLVELGNDVVVLLDSLTRLSRAYNISAPASGRILSGGVDASALYPPKRFFGAARNVENGGSLTILASALVETGSKADEVIFEEFKGTGNMEVRLSRQLADKRIFPAVDVPASGTRREEILMSREELQTVWKLRRVVTALDAQASIELLLDRLKKTRSNLEFLHQVQSSTPLAQKD
ncbi:transcription termination factor Rho [Kineococcus sp. SYSU DK004]|uniref:transcription termination factor Rho n=1 Tax=Kineococcus sp. SYSU DK004 TaxID=3383125 RepID=UPI003D7D7A59